MELNSFISAFLTAGLCLRFGICTTKLYYTKCSDSIGQNHSCSVGNEILQPCLSLKELSEENISAPHQNGYEIVIYFISGSCFSDENVHILLLNFQSVRLLSWRPGRYVSIQCTGDFTLEFESIRRLHFEYLKFIQCGKFRPVISLTTGEFEIVSLNTVVFVGSNHSSVEILSHVKLVNIMNCSFDQQSRGFASHMNAKTQPSANNYVNESAIIITNSNYTMNVGTSLYLVSFLTQINLAIQNCLFLNNNVSSDYHGVITMVSLANIKIMDSYFNNSYGAAAVIDCTNSTFCSAVGHSIVINNTNFEMNRGQAGGGIRVVGCYDIEVYNSIFLKNKANMGGSLYIEKSSACSSMSFMNGNSDFLFNYATEFGGALFLKSVDYISIFESEFVGNKVNKEGGAFMVQCFDSISIHVCNFSSNSATDGGAISLNSPILDDKAIYKLNISSTNFENNSAKHDGGAMTVQVNNLTLYETKFLNNLAKKEAGGIKIMAYGKNVNGSVGKVKISNCKWINNTASVGGAMTIRYIGISWNTLYLGRSHFFSNYAKVKGGAISVIRFQTNITETVPILDLRYSNFSMNRACYSDVKKVGLGGAVMFDEYKVVMKKCTFIYNRANLGGAIYCNKTSMRLKECNFENNMADTGGFAYLNETNITFNDSTMMSSNIAHINGGGIASRKSRIQFAGTLCIINNTVSNEKGKGGAIFIQDNKQDCEAKNCSLNWASNAKTYFLNNAADTGDLIYGGMLDRCISNDSPFELTKRSLSSLVNVNGSDYDSKSYGITSDVTKICFCPNAIPNCFTRNTRRMLHPGESYNVPVACLDQMDQPLGCDISGYFNDSCFQFDRGEQIRSISQCQNLTFHMFTNHQEQGTAVLQLESDIFCEQNSYNMLTVSVDVTPCPLGFENIHSQCKCDSRLQKEFPFAECNTTTNSIRIQTLGWFSYHGGYLRVHRNCPFSICSLPGKDITPTDMITQCNNNHSGILCGTCVSNYSISLGSWKCMNCSSSWYNFIWLTIVIALVGVALVVFLMLLKLTVSIGIINGLIFYANMISFSGLLDSQVCSINPVLRVFLLWINLDFGVEVCFYSGMDVYQKTWLQFVFPFYIWLLVGVIIVFCHYSSTVMKLMGMRNIEVLATLFLLSYGKLLKTIVSSLSYTYIKVASADNVSDPLSPQRVWVYNGEIEYLKDKHLLLFTASLFFLLFLVLPYTLLLLFGQIFQYVPKRRGLRWITSTTLTAILDAYHAPYTKFHRYWTGLGLLLRCSLFIIYGITQTYNLNSTLFWIIIATGFLLVVRLSFAGKVYKHRVAELFEVFFLSNLGFLASVLLYKGDNCKWEPNVFIALSLIAFVLMLIYHVHLEIIKSGMSYQQIFAKLTIKKHNLKPNEYEAKLCEENKPHGTSTSYFELRESLIEN